MLDAATTVFAQKGFRGATIRDIALAAGVSDGTIYNLFDNKSALLHGILAGAEPLAPAVDPDSPPSLSDMLRARWTVIGPDNLAMLRVVLSEALIDPDFRDLYRQTLLAPAIDQLVMPLTAHATQADPNNPALYDARIMTALFMGLIMLRLLGDETIEQGGDALLDRLTSFVEHGLALPATGGTAS
ncbi:MAG: TetR/AcrR family transcriptional regulator [Sphingomonadaceae bacterium]|nr:TetR/AcrR family transcriptional regulator [Sphingomonadaceae bacterium]